MDENTTGEQTTRCAVDGAVATITLTRPHTLNALTGALHRSLRETLDRLAVDDAVRVVMLTGEGRAFSSGQDLTEDLPRDGEGRIDLGPPLARDYNPLVLQLASYRKITIAALNGPAVGASVNIALGCDIVLAARSAYLQEAFSKIALIPDAGGTWILPRVVGPKLALALMLSADPIPAEEAQRLGLVFKVFDDASFRQDAAAFAARLAAGPAIAYRLTKEALSKSLENDLATQLALEATLQRQAGFSHDFAEGVAAFRGKRTPRFEGR